MLTSYHFILFCSFFFFCIIIYSISILLCILYNRYKKKSYCNFCKYKDPNSFSKCWDTDCKRSITSYRCLHPKSKVSIRVAGTPLAPAFYEDLYSSCDSMNRKNRCKYFEKKVKQNWKTSRNKKHMTVGNLIEKLQKLDCLDSEVYINTIQYDCGLDCDPCKGCKREYMVESVSKDYDYDIVSIVASDT